MKSDNRWNGESDDTPGYPVPGADDTAVFWFGVAVGMVAGAVIALSVRALIVWVIS